jgi:hypothetical protein
VADGRAIHVSVSEEQVRAGAILSVPEAVTADPSSATHETAPTL